MKFKLSGKKEWYLAVLIIVVGNLLGMGMAAVEKRSAKTDYLERNPYGEGAYEETLQVELEGKQEEIQIYVEEQKYTEADKKRYLKEAEKELNTWFQRVCGDKGEIRQSLSFPDKLEQNPVTLSWSTSQPQILDWEGVLGTGVAPKGEMVDLMCTITLEEEMKIWQKEVRVYPPRRTEKEALQEEIQVRAEKLSEENSKKMYLPETYQGEAVHYRRTAGNTGYLVCVLSVLLGFGIFPLKKERERQKEELRKKEMQRDYPDVLDKLVLFLQAGFSIRKAMEKLAIDYQRNRQKYHMKERAAYEGDMVSLEAVFLYHMPADIFRSFPVRIKAEGAARAWVGYNGEKYGTGKSEEMVYVTEWESVYHESQSCSYLHLSLEQVSSDRLEERKNQYGESYHKCDKCWGGEPVRGNVYITESGSHYHSSSQCSGLTRHVKLIKKSELKNLKVCTRCGGGHS